MTASGSGPLLAHIEMVELVYHKSVGGELGHAGRLNGLEGRRPAPRGVAVLLLRGEVGHAQPVMVLRLYLQATDHVLLRLGRHGPRPPVLPNPLSARNAITAEEGGQEHGTCGRGPQETTADLLSSASWRSRSRRRAGLSERPCPFSRHFSSRERGLERLRGHGTLPAQRDSN